MAKIKTVYDIKNRDDALCWSNQKRKEGRRVKIIEGGNHTKVEGPTGRCVPIWRHKQDFPKGTKRAIIRELIAAGLGIFAIAVPIVIAYL